MDLKCITLVELRDAIASGEISSTQATGFYLQRIEQHNGVLNAYREVFAEQALAKAAQVDAGKVKGALAGVPLAIKYNMCTDYGYTTCCSKMLGEYRSPFTATAVRRLEDAGAVILGKTIMDEFAMGGSTEHSACGPTRVVS